MADQIPQEAIDKAVAELDRPLAKLYETEAEALEALQAAYPAIRKQVIAEVEEALTKKLDDWAAGSLTQRRLADRGNSPSRRRGYATGLDRAAEDVKAALATLKGGTDG